MAATFPPALKRPGAEATDQELGLRALFPVDLELGWDSPACSVTWSQLCGS